MRILWVKTDLLHPANSGGRIRTLNMLRHLHRQHEVHYLALDDGQMPAEALAMASEYATTAELVPHRVVSKGSWQFHVDVAWRMASPVPVVLQRYVSGAWREAIRRVLRDRGPFDLCVCDFLFPALSMPESLPCPTVLFQHNVEARIWRRHADTAHGWRRLFFSTQHARMHRYEGQLSRRFDGVIAVSESDAAEMRTAYGLSNVRVVDTGVDTTYFHPSGEIARASAELVFLGSMDWMPNTDGVLWFTSEVLPIVRRSHPDVRFTIVGRSPTDAVQALAGNGITVTGTVPDVRPYLARASIFVVPLRVGGGTRIKLFEAMASEAPCVSTTIGAEGLPVLNGEHLAIADSAPDMAARIVELLNDPARAQAMGRAAGALVRARFDWSRIAEQFLDACRLSIGQSAAPIAEATAKC